MSAAVQGSAKRDGQFRVRSSGGIAVLEETYSYIVKATNKDEDYVSVLQGTGVPQVGATTSPTGYGRCRSVDGDRWPDNPYYWTVKAEFSSEIEENQNRNDGATGDPVTWIPIYETKFERLQEVATKDKSGNSIANSAGQPFETGLQVSRFIPIWEFWQFEPASVSDEAIIERNESVNSVSFKGRAAKTCLLTVISSTIGYYYGRRLRFSRYAVRYNSKKWTHKRLDVGTAYKSGSNLLPYTDTAGVNVILGALDGSGGKQPVGTAPAVREFDMFEEKRFQDFLRV